jgi:hypothetical protein
MAVRQAALCVPPLPPRSILSEVEPTPDHSVAGRIRSTENKRDLIRDRKHDLPACSAVPQATMIPRIRFEFFTAVTMKNGVFCDVTPRGSCKNRRFGGSSQRASVVSYSQRCS